MNEEYAGRLFAKEERVYVQLEPQLPIHHRVSIMASFQFSCAWRGGEGPNEG